MAMAGWKNQYGALIEGDITESEYQRLFNRVFSDQSKKTTTYKFAFIKALLDSIYSVEPIGSKYYLQLDDVFDKFSENYWNLVVKHGLKQHRKSIATSSIENVLQPYCENENYKTFKYANLTETDRSQIVQEVKRACKKYVIGALHEDFEGKLYGFDLKKADYLELKDLAVFYMRKHKAEIEKLNYYSWAKFLETSNEKESQIISHLEQSTPKRENLSVYRELLKKEFEDNCCFYCGHKLDKIQVDHVIPWSFMKDDHLWNFVLSCPKCNNRKKDKLPVEKYLDLVIKRNEELLKSTNEAIIKEMETYPANYKEIWEYAQNSGYAIMKENTFIKDTEEEIKCHLSMKNNE